MDDIQPLYPRPTAQVQPYVDALGVETTIEFLLSFGGAELPVASDPKGNGMLVRCIGYQKAKQLADISHLLQNRVPLASRWLAQCLYTQGLSKAAIARRLRLSDVTVRSYLRGINARFPNG